jgi:hypothetical protein
MGGASRCEFPASAIVISTEPGLEAPGSSERRHGTVVSRCGTKYVLGDE